MAWLARSIANTLNFDDVDEKDSKSDVSVLNEDRSSNISSNTNAGSPETEQNFNRDPLSPSPTASPRGVKDDISEITKTLTRQFWGVASFLAPPPQPEPYKSLEESESSKRESNSDSGSDSDQAGIMGIRNDFAEIGGKFRTGISMISNNIAVSEITKMASNFLQLGSDNEEEEVEEGGSTKGAVGVTNEVVSFARDIAMHPETWLDFPLPESADDDDFEMSDAQQEHALAVEHLAPRLAALRIELCPGYMSESCFWKIYFVLLHPRLSKEDADLLSTSQIVKARALLSHELQNHSKTEVLAGEDSVDVKDSSRSENEEPLFVPSSTDHDNVPIASVLESSSSSGAVEYATEKHPVRSIEIQNAENPVISETSDKNQDQKLDISSKYEKDEDEDDADDWLKEESTEVAGVSGGATVTVENEEDVSFSDLEEDDVDLPANFKKASPSSDRDSPDWVQL